MVSNLVLLLVAVSTVWVGVDSRGRRWPQGTLARSTAGWVFGCLVLWIVVLPMYLVQRGRAPKADAADRQPTLQDPAARTSVAPPATRS
jgi:hypothetical protein